MQRLIIQLFGLIMLFHKQSALRLITGRARFRSILTLSSEQQEPKNDNSDILLSGLNADKDIAVKIVSCRELIQEVMLRQDMTSQAATALGELMTCTLLMGAGLKDDETLQVNLVGNTGLGNVMAITDGLLKARGTVRNRSFETLDPSVLRMREMLGDGQVQVVRSHPLWKYPTNGIVALRDVKISLNMALYMAESEQRTAAILTDVRVDGGLVRHALGVIVETLPGATPENVETSIRNLETVERHGLRHYLDITPVEKKDFNGEFRSLEPALGRVLDDCLGNMGEEFRISKKPQLRCSCGVDRVWRMLAVLPKDDLKYIVETEGAVEIKCEFCAKKYKVERDEIIEKLLSPIS